MTGQRSDIEDALSKAAEILAGKARPNGALGALTTYRVGGAAALFMVIEGQQDLALVSRVLSACTLPVLVIGRGSNMLVADAGFQGLAIMLGETYNSIDFGSVETDSDKGPAQDSQIEVHAGGAVLLPVLARKSASKGLRGLEWAVGVPGSVGGAIKMNAGGHGSDIESVLRQVHLFDLEAGKDENMTGEMCDFGYRHSNITSTQVVLRATFALAQGDADLASAEIDSVVSWRRENQPGGQNAGSVFTNPAGDSAGRLIEAAGCKGLRIGSAEVSMKHANFIQADPGGSADDVAYLVAEVRKRVESSMGIKLQPELRIFGFNKDLIAQMTGY